MASALSSFARGLVLGAVNPRLALENPLLIAAILLALTALPLVIAGSSVGLLAVAVFASRERFLGIACLGDNGLGDNRTRPAVLVGDCPEDCPRDCPVAQPAE